MSKLLLLEDDLSLINGLSFAFQKAGHELDIARTLREAEALWQEGKYDLLVLDVSLPDGSGFGFGRPPRSPLFSSPPPTRKPASLWGWTSAGTTTSQSPSSWRSSCPESTPSSVEASILSKHLGSCPPTESPSNCWRAGPIKAARRWS